MKTTNTRVALLMAVFLGAFWGCSSVPSARRYIREAEKADEVGNMELVLKNMEIMTDIFPQELAKERRAEVLAMYRRNQIAYGVQQSDRAETRGDLIEAWVWAVQTASVEPENPECKRMADRAETLYDAIGASFMEQAQDSLAANRPEKAFSYAIKASWYGAGDAAAPLLTAIAGNNAGSFHPGEVIHGQGVKGILRTDSLEQFGAQKAFAPYGLPIYFGDIPQYYQFIQQVKVKGTPVPRELPQEYTKVDALFQLTSKARRVGADALVNVHMWTTRKKVYTIGDAIRLAHLPYDGTEESPVVLKSTLDNP